MAKSNWNKKVADSRGEAWKKALVEGKMQSKLNPTKLQRVRAEKQVAQTSVANAMNLSLATYGAIERAKRPVKNETALKIAAFFECSSTSLFKKHEKDKLVAR